MTTLSVIAVIVLILAVFGLVTALFILRDKLNPSLKKSLAAICVVLAAAALITLSISAGTGALFPTNPPEPFVPALNGTYEDQPDTNGSTYSGEFKDGYWEGEGTLTYKDGATYTGTFVKGLRSGEGTLKRANGETYTGSWLNDQMSGQGTYRYKDGKVYEGTWKQGLCEGEGKLTYPDGSIYQGSFVAGMQTGKGIYPTQMDIFL